MTIKQLEAKKIPYICTPLTGKNKESILNELNSIISKKPDLIEWRADFLKTIDNTEQVLSIAEDIVSASDIPVLFTIRSEQEGGEEIPLSEEERVQLICDMCQHSDVDIIDYEVSCYSEHIKKIRTVSRANNKKLILSYHNFDVTPDNPELMKRLFMAGFFDADMAKVAVMPENKDDVLRLLEQTKKADKTLSIPLITMSMGTLGQFSRIVGWAYGSVLTFAVGTQSSAPGQVPVDKLKQLIDMTQEIIGEWT